MKEEREDYLVKTDEAAIVIKPTGEVECLMPNQDVDDNDGISTDSPTFKAMVIMMFIGDEKMREEITNKLISTHFMKD